MNVYGWDGLCQVAFGDGFDKGAAAERAKIVAWLRTTGVAVASEAMWNMGYPRNPSDSIKVIRGDAGIALEAVASAIESGASTSSPETDDDR